MLSASSTPLALTPSGRLSYARIAEVVDGISDDKFEVPNLIELQLESFRWFVDKGLRDLFDEISPIEDFTKKVMELRFGEYEFGTAEKEAMEVLGGVMDVKLPGAEWRRYAVGDSFEVPAQSKFQLRIAEPADYCCSYLK